MTLPKAVTNVLGAFIPNPATSVVDLDGTFLTVYNNTATAITAGQAVVLNGVSTLGQPQITTTTTQNSALVAGVAIETIPAGGSGIICIQGFAIVNVTSSGLTAGTLIGTSTTAGSAQGTTPPSTAGTVLGKVVGYVPSSTTQVIAFITVS